MRFLNVAEILELHRLVMEQSGGAPGVRDMGGVESAAAQPRMTFDGAELYPSLAEKGAALGYSLVCNHPFVDGNKRIGHAAMETFFVLNGWELNADVDEQEQIILRLAAGGQTRGEFTAWVESHIRRRDGGRQA
ncbi:MAG: type II toxin-antitoxin system death-on-curing family toxin [Planctomycetia bacterium]